MKYKVVIPDSVLCRLGGVQNNNKCRNPDSDTAPWCLTGAGEYELCDIPACVPRSLEEAVEEAVEEAGCGADQFQCRAGECIFSGCEYRDSVGSRVPRPTTQIIFRCL